MTSERSVAFDGLAEPEPAPEFDELVWCVGATGCVGGGVDPVVELFWVSVTLAPAGAGWAGVSFVATAR